MNLPFQSLHFIVYELCQDHLNAERHYSPLTHVVSGAIAGGVAAAATTPLDVCKTLLNTQEKRAVGKYGTITGLRHAMRTIYRHRGVRGYFMYDLDRETLKPKKRFDSILNDYLAKGFSFNMISRVSSKNEITSLLSGAKIADVLKDIDIININSNTQVNDLLLDVVLAEQPAKLEGINDDVRTNFINYDQAIDIDKIILITNGSHEDDDVRYTL